MTIEQLLCAITEPGEMKQVLKTFLTTRELRELNNRLKIIEMLAQGVSQRQIASKLGVGIATVTRGAQACHHHHKILGKYVVPNP